MIKAGRDLKVLFPNLLHVICSVHAGNVNTFISAVKKVFLKAPLRHALLHED